jgi:glycosyltransferase involved in cell wall biosynthesis/2-polyprenyl-3-methyl-5-hydroxy-6-metoxy-1,4-benzoquinol methylase
MKKSIAFATLGLSFNGNTIYEKALGGSESAMIYMAKELHKLGNDVTVYCNCDRPGTYEGVVYKNCDDFGNDENLSFDVLIDSRFPQFLTYPVTTKLNILWAHDVFLDRLDECLGMVESVFVLSDFHKKLFTEKYHFRVFKPEHFWQTSNGYDSDIEIKDVSFESKKNNYIYGSRPERGLKFLLKEIWPKIVEKNPDAVLHLTGYDYPDYGLDNETKNEYKKVDKLIEKSKNIIKTKKLNKKDYYKLLSECGYLLYPTEFPEISCITAMEAQRSGCLVLTSDDSALAETVKTNTKVKSKFGTQEYVDEFLSVLEKYQDKDLYEKQIEVGKKSIEDFSWKRVAKTWNEKIDSLFIERHEKYKDKIIENLIHNSDLVAAWKLTGREDVRKLIDLSYNCNVNQKIFMTREDEDDYSSTVRWKPLVKIVKNLIKENPNKKLKIVDLGSNNGLLSLPLLKRFSKNIESVVLFDSNKKALEWTKNQFGKKYKQLETINDTLNNLNNYNLECDIVIAGEILEHIENTKSFLNSCKKLANDNTLYYFTTPFGPWENDSKSKKIPKIYGKRTIEMIEEGLEHVHHFEISDLKQIFKNVNVTFVRDKDDFGMFNSRMELLCNHCFYFKLSKKVDVEFGDIDYQEKWIKSRPYRKISCCMIVKNEEDNLSRCLKSVKNYVDEIIILDTGSTDDTKQIAAKFTDQIITTNWEEEDGLGNFARARNLSIIPATGDYIFWIDADEETENFGFVFKYLMSDYWDAINFKQLQCVPEKSEEFERTISCRVFKNNKIFNFSNVIHEYVSEGMHEGKKTDMPIQNALLQFNCSILHYGYARLDKMTSKFFDRNNALIEKNYKLNPNNDYAKQYYLFNLMHPLLNRQRPSEKEDVEKVISMWKKILESKNGIVFHNCFSGIQTFYEYMLEQNITYNGLQPKKGVISIPGKTKKIPIFTLIEEEMPMYGRHGVPDYKIN